MNTDRYHRSLVPFCLTLALLYGTPGAHSQGAGDADGPTPDSVTALTLSAASELALSRNPKLKAGGAAIRAAAARAQQAGVLPNPEIEAEIEDVGLSGEERGLDASIYTVRAAQTFETGGKRAKRRRAASLEVLLANWDLEAERLDLLAEVRSRFIDLLAAQERVRVVTASHELGRKVRDTAAERVRSGKVSPLELTKADVELAGRRVELQRAERELAAARIALAALWNAPLTEAVRLRAEGDLRRVPALPEFAELEARLDGTPEMARWETEEQLAQAAVIQEKAARIPDVTVSAGLAHERESGHEVVEFAVSLPLPFFDRNRGNIRAALAEQERIREDQRAVAIALRAELAEQWQELQAAREEATSIEDEMLPGARRAFAAAEEAYRSGKLEYLDVLDAQQTLVEAEMQHLEALSSLHQTVAVIERLVGGGLSE